MEDDELPELKNDSELPIIPNYLANPPFPYVYNTMSNNIPDPSVNGSISCAELQDPDSSPLPETCTQASVQQENAAPEAAGSKGAAPSLPGGCAVPRCSNPAVQNGPIYQTPASWSRSPPSPVGSKQPGPQLGNGPCTGPVPTFQPVFFTGAFPLNMQGNSKSLSSHLFLEIFSPRTVKMD